MSDPSQDQTQPQAPLPGGEFNAPAGQPNVPGGESNVPHALDVLATPPSSLAPVRAPQSKKPVLTWILGGVVAVGVLFGGGFFVGRTTAPDPTPSAYAGRPGSGTTGQGAEGRWGAAGGTVRGEITSVDGETLTITAEDGSSTSVTVSDDTQVTHVEEGSPSDLEVGDTVTVMGSTEDSDSGDLTALSITEGDSASGLMGGAFRPGDGFPDGAPTGVAPSAFPRGEGGFPGGAPGGEGGFPGGEGGFPGGAPGGEGGFPGGEPPQGGQEGA
ncbi:MAG: DUF5666 domain-containing protein [Bifidobacteriaceae bacterium]|nr:DUF5666 domain-containing protein [Bifidobacteriaceae bacterium]